MGASGSDPTEREFTGLSKAQRPGRHNTAVEEDSVYSGGNGSRKATARTYSTSLLTRVDKNAIMCEHRSASSKIFTRFSGRNASGNGRRKFALCTWSWWAFFCIHVHVLRAVTQVEIFGCLGLAEDHNALKTKRPGRERVCQAVAGAQSPCRASRKVSGLMMFVPQHCEGKCSFIHKKVPCISSARCASRHIHPTHLWL
ncbi:hypothetical protein DPX16_15785 [Anabarilius grahami]|uniref:Uncharacterized protein n=1 Tax=Anabarilius grahami TaxID=495550 RepID=A0A3N0YTE0_ANAGA|nr:hypothetical protein DPX16_15785 [Anabarilius grahami]